MVIDEYYQFLLQWLHISSVLWFYDIVTKSVQNLLLADPLHKSNHCFRPKLLMLSSVCLKTICQCCYYWTDFHCVFVVCLFYFTAHQHWHDKEEVETESTSDNQQPKPTVPNTTCDELRREMPSMQHCQTLAMTRSMHCQLPSVDRQWSEWLVVY